MNLELSASGHTVLGVAVDLDGERLDRFLLRSYSEVNRATILDAIARGEVLVNGRRAVKGERLRAGDAVSLPRLRPPAAEPNPGVPIDVRHEDDHLLVVVKAAGLPCHPLRAGEVNTLVSGLLARYPGLAEVGVDRRELGLVHRLDTDTSGLVLVARSSAVLAALRTLLREGHVDKRYVARCLPRPGAVLIEGPVRGYLLADHRRRVRVSERPGVRQRSITTIIYGCTPLDDGTVLVRCGVEHAGRHQVRAHLAALGFPLLGDPLYGGPAREHGHLLHASGLAFRHPMTGESMRIESELPSPFTAPL